MSAILAGRRLAQRLMLDTCTVAAPLPQSEWTVNETTGVVTVTYGAALYTGRCKVQTYEAYEANPQSGGATYTVQRYVVHVPVAQTTADYRPEVDHVITIATAATDPHLAGRQYRVVALLHKSLPTAYRLGVEEVV